MDIGGNSALEDTPQPITVVRSPNDPEQRTVTIPLPEVDQDLMVIVRLESAMVSDRTFISVINDPGIDGEPVWDIYPDQNVLSGMYLYFKISPPEEMADMAQSSEVIVENPVGNHHINHFKSGKWRSIS